MSSITVLQEFKKVLISFFDELIEKFPEEGDLVVIRILLKDRAPVSDVMAYFIGNVLPEKGLVKERDPRFFTTSNALFGMLNKVMGEGKDLPLRKIWTSPKLDKDDREVMWRWIDSLILLVERYQKVLENENK